MLPNDGFYATPAEIEERRDAIYEGIARLLNVPKKRLLQTDKMVLPRSKGITGRPTDLLEVQDQNGENIRTRSIPVTKR